jgi:hypothetical protein
MGARVSSCPSKGSYSLAIRKDLHPAPLVCVECGRVQGDDERGWRSYLTIDEDDPVEAMACCPDCADREFGQQRGRAAAD